MRRLNKERRFGEKDLSRPRKKGYNLRPMTAKQRPLCRSYLRYLRVSISDKQSVLWSAFSVFLGFGVSHKLPDHAKGKILRFLCFLHKNLRILVGVAGFEPTASWTRTKRDTKLRHTPKSPILQRMKRDLSSVSFGNLRFVLHYDIDFSRFFL